MSDDNYNTEPGKDQEALPELYSKRLILVFAVLFSAIFASFLLAANLRTLKESQARVIVLAFAFIYTIGTGVLLQLLGLPPTMSFISNVVGAAILNEFFWNKYIGAQREYHKKDWIKPMLIAMLIALSLFFLLLGL